VLFIVLPIIIIVLLIGYMWFATAFATPATRPESNTLRDISRPSLPEFSDADCSDD
jgi:hypothetical protein